MSKEIEIAKEMIVKGKKMIAEAESKLAELEVTYSIGDRFQSDHIKYMLVNAGQKQHKEVILIRLDDGTTWTSGNEVQYKQAITKNEMYSISGCRTFTRYWNFQKQIYTGEKKK